MEILLTPAPVALRRPRSYRAVATAPVLRERAANDLIRLASAGAIGFSIAVPLVVLLLFAASPLLSPRFPEAAAATTLYLPLYVRHVRYGLRGSRPHRLPLTLGAMAVVLIGVTPLLGADWFYAYGALVASVLVTTPPRFSLPAVACILTGAGVWAAALSNETGTGLFGGGQAIYFPIAVADRAAAVFVLVWLVGALRRVQSARTALAAVALEAERGRIDGELSGTIGSELEAVVVKGVRAEDAAKRGSPKAQEELESLVEGSRRALANARRMTRGYKLAAPVAELEKAALLLRAGGIEATVEVPDSALPPSLDASLRSALQVAVAQLLTEEAAGPVVLKLGCANGQFRLETVRLSKREPFA